MSRPTHRSASPATALVLAALCTAAAPGRTPPPADADGRLAAAPNHVGMPDLPNAVSDDERTARLLGILLYTPVMRSFQDVPAREAFRTLAGDLAIPIIGRYDDDAIGHGIDPTMPVFVEGAGRAALDVIEDILAQCEGAGACTWQLRRGFVEVGTKSRLATMQETRSHDIRDLLLEAPYFKPDGAPSAGGSVSRQIPTRKRPEDIAAEIIGAIAVAVEPEAWWPEHHEGIYKQPSSIGSGAGGSPYPGASAHPADVQADPLKLAGKWASCQYFRGVLIVRAPDFIHRQISGYPPPVRPVPPDRSPGHRADH